MTTGTFIDDLRPLNKEEKDEVKNLIGGSFDYSSLEALESCLVQYQNETEHFIGQFTAIIKTDADDGHFRHADALNDHMLHRLELRAIAASEVASQVEIFSHELSEKLKRFSKELVIERNRCERSYMDLINRKKPTVKAVV